MGYCAKCKTDTKSGFYSSKNVFFCNGCRHEVELYLYDEFKINEQGEVEIISPFSAYSESDKRAKFIEICYTIFKQNLSKAAYPLMNKWVSSGKYTWLGMARAMEWYYVINRNSIEKAKNSIGIIPYIYDKAQEHYALESKMRKKKWDNYKPQKETVVEEVKVTTVKKVNAIDLNNL